jgi:5-hydroxyisourate hydrolase-like protein (transthyretin family)
VTDSEAVKAPAGDAAWALCHYERNPMNLLRRLTGKAHVKATVTTTAALATAALILAPAAPATTPVLVPAGGDFEQTPLVYSTQASCGLLCRIATSRQAEGANHYLHTEYETLLGLIGTDAGTATISSPQFTWTKSTPSAVTFAIERRSALNDLLGINSGVTFTTALVDDTASTTTTILSEELATSQPAFAPVSVTVPAADVADGHTYHLVITESFHSLLGAVGAGSVDIDNAALAITPSATAPSIGTTSLGAPGEHSVTGTATIDPHGEQTTYGLQYGTSITYGSESALGTIPEGAEGFQQVTSSLGGLLPNTSYHARFVVKDAAGTAFGPDMTFTTAASSPPSLGGASVGAITETGAIVDATVDPGQNATGVLVEYGPTTGYGQTTATQNLAAGSGATSVQIPIAGLSASTTYHARVVATNADGSVHTSDLSFSTTAGGGSTAPAIGATSATAIAERTATLQTTANPHGEAATYDVEYGLNAGYGSTTSTQTIASGTSGAQPLSVALAGLTPGTTYHARVTVSSTAGVSHGLDVVFTTAALSPPSVSAASVGSIGESAATVDTTVNPGQNETSVAVEYGPTTGYGQTTTSQNVPGGSGATAVHVPLSALSANTTYHARVTVTNADGSSESQDLTFMTTSGGTGGAGNNEAASIESTSVAGLGEHVATIDAVINPHGQEAAYEVQYGTSTGYGSVSVSRPIPLGTSGGSPVSIPLSGLQAGTSYHARFRVLSSAGTSTGADVAFTTSGPSGTANPGTEGSGSGSGSGPGASSAANGSGAGAGTGVSGAAACLRVQAKRRGPAAKYLTVPTIEQISAAHPLSVGLAKAAGKKTKLRYSIAGAPYVSTSARVVKLAPSQLKSSTTAIRFVLAAAHRKTRSLRLVVSSTPCGVVLSVKRVGGQLQVTVSRLTRSHGVALSLPRALAAPSALTLVPTKKNHPFRLKHGRRGITLAPKAAKPLVRRSSGALSVTGLSEQVTGLVLRFPARSGMTGAIKARITSAGGSVQAVSASLK